MKRKLLAISLSLVVTSSFVLSGCGSKNESVASSAKEEEAVKDTEEATEVEKAVKSTEAEGTEVETETTVESTESEESVNEAKESTSGKTKETTSTSGSKSGNTSGSSTSGSTSNSKETAHVHNWTPVTTTVHHDAVTHQEDQGSYITVVDQEAYDSEEPVMERDTYCITCYNNGEIVRLHGQAEVDAHLDYHSNIGNGFCQYACKSLQTGTQTVHHDAITHQEWQSNMVTVTDKPAYDEEVVTGYVCSECGATK